MEMDWQPVFFGLVGGCAVEGLEWFRIRKELHKGVPDWSKNWLYWIVTVGMAGLSGCHMRVNARLDDERAEKLQQLQSLPRLSASEIVKRAIDLLYRHQSGQSRDKLDALSSSDFVGCANGPADLASQYKRYLTRDLEDKQGLG